jgi:hypothetical protein
MLIDEETELNARVTPLASDCMPATDPRAIMATVRAYSERSWPASWPRKHSTAALSLRRRFDIYAFLLASTPKTSLHDFLEIATVTSECRTQKGKVLHLMVIRLGRTVVTFRVVTLDKPAKRRTHAADEALGLEAKTAHDTAERRLATLQSLGKRLQVLTQGC